MIKFCNTCKQEKNISEFYIAKASKDGYSSQCKECIKARQAKYNAAHREEQRLRDAKYRKENIDKIREREKSPERQAYLKKYREEHKLDPEYSKQWYQENRERVLERQKLYGKSEHGKKVKSDYYKNNRSKMLEYAKQYRIQNAEIIKKRDRERYNNDRLGRNISNMIWCFCNGLKCERHWEDLLPYTLQELKEHLEKQFSDGMSWNNYGREGWVVDHIIPQNFFKPIIDTNSTEFKICWSLNNLRPLWAKDNLSRPRDEGSDILDKIKFNIISKALDISIESAKDILDNLTEKYYKKVNSSL